MRTKLKNARCWHPGGWTAFNWSVSSFFLTFVMRLALRQILHDDLSMLFFSLNCIVIAYFFGFYYAIGLFIVAIPTSFYFFKIPYYEFSSFELRDAYTIVLYGSTVLLSSVLLEWLQRERYTAVLLQRVSESRYQLLIESDQARRAEMARRYAAKSEDM